MFRVFFFVAAVVATAQAYNATNCLEVPACLNEYQWKHKATQTVATDFCAKRYPTCTNANGSDMKQYCATASPQCDLFVYNYLGFTNEAKVKSESFCKERLPRC